VRIENKLIDH
jgi:cytoskeletal protein CcmA (bactofilin family)